MTKSEQYVEQCIRNWVWSGFYSERNIDTMIDDVVDEDCDIEMLKALVEPEFERKRAAQRTWPQETDCDRLDRVFWLLHREGICALPNAGYDMSDGHSEVSEAVSRGAAGRYTGYCFYHGQDVERALQGYGLMLAFGDLHDNAERSVQIGRRIAESLRLMGFAVEWDETHKTRINLPSIQWQRRGDVLEDEEPVSSHANHPGFIVFYQDYSAGGLGQVEPTAKRHLQIDQVGKCMGEVLLHEGNFFGLVDADEKTLQFVVDPDNTIRAEFLVAEQRGSMTRNMLLRDALELIQSAGPSLAELPLPGFVFEKW